MIRVLDETQRVRKSQSPTEIDRVCVPQPLLNGVYFTVNKYLRKKKN